MKTILLSSVFVLLSGISFAQALTFSEIGYDPAYCRLYAYQSGNGVVYAAATGGTPDYTYLWKNLATGATNVNSVWGGLNPGDYEITVTDAAANVIVDTVTVDSLNPIAAFDVISADLDPFPGGYIGYTLADVQFVNQSLYVCNPDNPFCDTLYYWNLDYPDDPWVLTHDWYENFYKLYFPGVHEVALVAMNNNGCADTTIITIGIFGPAAIEDVENSTSFRLNPDVEKQQLHIEQKGFDNGIVLRVYDISGILVYENAIEALSSSVPFNATRGIYVYETRNLADGGLLSTGKFVY